MPRFQVYQIKKSHRLSSIMQTRLLDAYQRFTNLWNAISSANSAESDALRENLLTAYGNPDKTSADKNLAAKELAIAESCLAGEGAKSTEFYLLAHNENSLISVLAKELGLVQMDDNQAISRPWLGGDWVSMAELIIHITSKKLGKGGDPFPKEPFDMIRVFRVEWDSGKRDNVFVAHPLISDTKEKNQTFYLLSTNTKLALGTTGIEWISICVPPSKLHLISEQLPNQKMDGVPENLWEFLPAETEPGTEELEDYR